MAEIGTYVDSGNISRKVVSVAAGEAHTLVLTGNVINMLHNLMYGFWY